MKDRVTIDPAINFGQPSVNGITVYSLIQRFIGGDSIGKLGTDYKLADSAIEAALHYALDLYVRQYGSDVLDPVDRDIETLRESIDDVLEQLQTQIADMKRVIDSMQKQPVDMDWLEKNEPV